MQTPQQRTFKPFPAEWDPETEITFDQFVENLLQRDSSGFLIHGGPGSGKSNLLRYLTSVLADNEQGLIIGPINMSPYRGQMHPDSLLHDLAFKMRERIADVVPDVLPATEWTRQTPTAALLRHISQILKQFGETGIRRAVLLLDDFDDIHLWAAISLANRLRELYDEHKRYFTFVLVAESDLEELKNAEHVYSPLKNITISYLLSDLTNRQVQHYAVDFAAEHGFSLTAEDRELLWEWTEGYPALVNGILKKLRDERPQTPTYSVKSAVEFHLRYYRQIEPFRTAVRTIEELNNLNVRDYNPARVLDLLNQENFPRATDRGARMLLAMGVLGWRGRAGRRYLTWRNPFIQTFWRSEENGQRLIANWLERPLSFRESQLSAQGSVAVSLFMDMAPLLIKPDRYVLNMRRGTESWRDSLRKLSGQLPDGPFSVWQDQERLTNIGFDLNLFRERTVHKSFMPTYEARAQDISLDLPALLARFGEALTPEVRRKAEDTIEQEWRRWDRVHLQFTRDGAVHIKLIRDIANSLPLMQILDELLGLERELDGGNLIEFSVQWELAMALVGAFMRQLGQENFPHIPILDLAWQGPKAEPKASEVYPLRDRYVIFMLRKLCNCRQNGLKPAAERNIVSVKDLEPLRQGGQQAEHLEAYNYGRELACLLEGVMIEQNKDHVGHFPTLKSDVVRKLLDEDLSSWENELFLASLDNALLVYQANRKIGRDQKLEGPTNADGVCQVCNDWEERTIGALHFPKRTVPYEDYWQCLSLGLQYIIELRWSAQWVARHTTADLEHLANLMGKEIADRPASEVQTLSQHIALTTRLLAHLRDASIPMFMSSADYAANKYQQMIEISGLPEAIQNAEKNIQSLNTFLYHHEEQFSQLKAQQQSDMIEKLGFVLAILALLIAIPSMWIDFGGGDGETALWRYMLEFAAKWSDKPFPLLVILTIIPFTLLFLVYRSVKRRRTAR